MKLTIARYLTSAGKGMIGYNELYGRADACFQIMTGASDTATDPSYPILCRK